MINSARANAAITLRRALAATWRDVRTTRRRVRRDPASAPATHDFRIAVRRLRAVLEMLALHDLRCCARIQKKLDRAFRAAGRLRDAQVAARELALLEPRFPVASRIWRALQKTAVSSTRRFERRLEACDSGDLKAATRESDRALQRLARAGIAVDDRAALVLAAARADLERQGQAMLAHPDASALHEFRISLKRVRYMTEWLSPVLTKLRWQRYGQRLAELQTLLGRIADLRMMIEAVDQWSLGRAGRTAACRTLCAALSRQLQQKTAEFVRRYRPLSRRFRAADSGQT